MLEAAYTGNFDAAPLRFGEAISNRVEKAGCQYYVLDLTQCHIDQVFLFSSIMFLAPWAWLDQPSYRRLAGRVASLHLTLHTMKRHAVNRAQIGNTGTSVIHLH